MDKGEEKEHKSSHIDERKPLPKDTSFNRRRDVPRPAFQIMARTKNANPPETEASGLSEGKGNENQPDLHISTSTKPYEQQNPRRDGSEPGKDCGSSEFDNDGDNWSSDDSDDEGGVKLF